MKKVLAVFMAILMAFSAMSLVVFAEDAAPADEPETTTEVIRYPEDTGIRDILNGDGLVFPINFNQLEMSFVFKIVEKIINFFLGLFGGDIDANLTDSVSDAGVWLDEAISNIAGSLG